MMDIGEVCKSSFHNVELQSAKTANNDRTFHGQNFHWSHVWKVFSLLEILTGGGANLYAWMRLNLVTLQFRTSLSLEKMSQNTGARPLIKLEIAIASWSRESKTHGKSEGCLNVKPR